jgi:hypothetical protein
VFQTFVTRTYNSDEFSSITISSVRRFVQETSDASKKQTTHLAAVDILFEIIVLLSLN